jgi:hypothetical protein
MVRLFFMTIAFVVTASGLAQKTPAYFEGTIMYDVKNESFMKGVSDNEIRERLGAKMKFYFKNGDYTREYLDAAGYTIRRLTYLKTSGIMYDHDLMNTPDSIFTIDTRIPFYDSFAIEKGEPETVLDCVCPSAVIHARFTASYLPEPLQLSLVYYFCYDLPINPDWHKDINLWGEIIKIHKSISVKFIEESIFYKQTFTAEKINKETVDPAIFRIDPKLIQKPLPR